MKQYRSFEQSLYEILEIPEEDRFWNGSIDDLKKIIQNISDPELKREKNYKLEVLIHKSQKKMPETSNVNGYIKTLFDNIPSDVMEISAKIKEEMLIPPTIFDFLTRQSLTDDKETNKYNIEVNKKKDEFFKKNKKKYKNGIYMC